MRLKIKKGENKYMSKFDKAMEHSVIYTFVILFIWGNSILLTPTILLNDIIFLDLTFRILCFLLINGNVGLLLYHAYIKSGNDDKDSS